MAQEDAPRPPPRNWRRRIGWTALLILAFGVVLVLTLWAIKTRRDNLSARIQALIASFDTPNPDLAKTSEVISALREIGAPAVPALLQALEGGSDTRRGGALNVFSNMGPEAAEAVPALIAATRKGDGITRISAANALSKIAPTADEAASAVIPVLTEALESGGYLWSIRASAAWSLGRFGARAKAAQPVLEKLRREDNCDSARDAYTEALAKIGTSSVALAPAGARGSSGAAGSVASGDDTPRDAKARAFAIYWGDQTDAKPMQVVFDRAWLFGHNLDAVLVDADCDGHIDTEVRRNPKTGLFEVEPDPLVTIGGFPAHASLSANVEKHPNGQILRLYPKFRLTKDGTEWSYRFMHTENMERKDQDGIEELRIGQPLQFHVDAEFWSEGMDLHLAAEILSGKGTALSAVSEAERKVRPRLTVTDPKGKKIADRDLDLDGSGSLFHSVRVEEPGEYTVRLSIDLGPYQTPRILETERKVVCRPKR